RGPEQGHRLAGGAGGAAVVARGELPDFVGGVADFDAPAAPRGGASGRAARPDRHSTRLLTSRVTRARKARREATANAAWKLYSLYRISTWSGIVLVSPRMWPETTDTPPHSRIA